MFSVIRALDFNKNLTGEEIEIENTRYFYNRKKKREQANYPNLVFKIVKINIDTKEERERIEAAYAHKNKAIFWSSAPGQDINI